MPHKIALKNIANGIIGSFNSRNNDVDGYWGLGKLFRFAVEENTTKISIDLLKETVNENEGIFVSLIAFYRGYLQGKLEKVGLSEECLSSAVINVEFECEYDPRYHYFRSALGRRYICSCVLGDKNGRCYSVKAGGICWPHDPRKESQRGRLADI